MNRYYPARRQIIAPKKTPFAVMIRRKPSRKFHIMVWDLETNGIQHGSSFTGKLQRKVENLPHRDTT